jgi:protein-L-isoaspartate(D-aspartate) O-methyltransferase
VVVGVEYIQGLAEQSKQNLANDPASKSFYESNTIKIVHGDGWRGWSENAPYDVIHVGAAAETIPRALLDQLASPGRLVIPVGGKWLGQDLLCVDKDA